MNSQAFEVSDGLQVHTAMPSCPSSSLDALGELPHRRRARACFWQVEASI